MLCWTRGCALHEARFRSVGGWHHRDRSVGRDLRAAARTARSVYAGSDAAYGAAGMDGRWFDGASIRHRPAWARLSFSSAVRREDLYADWSLHRDHVGGHRHYAGCHGWLFRRVDRRRDDVHHHLPSFDSADPGGAHCRGACGQFADCGDPDAWPAAVGALRRGIADHDDAGEEPGLHCRGTRRWCVAFAHRIARGAAEYRDAADRGGHAGDGAGDPAGGGTVVPRSWRAAAAAVLGAYDRRGEGLHVLQSMGDHDSRGRVVRPGAWNQSAGRWAPRHPSHGACVTTVLEVSNLRVTFGTSVAAVRDISLSVARGETHCLVGESGCGKSVTALAIMGLLARNAHRSAGVLRFHDHDLTRLNERGMARLRGDKLAMIFQEPMTSLNPAYTIGSQMAEVLERHRGVSRAAALDRAAELLARVGITAPGMRLKQYPHQLSGGLRQRVMISMALMCEPELLIADEPTTALDVTIQAQILRLLQSLQKEFGLAILLITHDLGIVARIADRVSVMYAGELVESAPTGQLFAAPQHPYTRGLLSCVPVPGK